MAAGLTLLTACSTSRKQPPEQPESQSVASTAPAPRPPATAPPEPLSIPSTAGQVRGDPDAQALSLPVGIRELEDGGVKVFLPTSPLPAGLDLMSVEEAYSLLAALILWPREVCRE